MIFFLMLNIKVGETSWQDTFLGVIWRKKSQIDGIYFDLKILNFGNFLLLQWNLLQRTFFTCGFLSFHLVFMIRPPSKFFNYAFKQVNWNFYRDLIDYGNHTEFFVVNVKAHIQIKNFPNCRTWYLLFRFLCRWKRAWTYW